MSGGAFAPPHRRVRFLDGKRLVTLVGIGGIGKTRLALELGANIDGGREENVHLVELAGLTAELVESAVLESVGGAASRAPLESAVEHLRDRSALLVLDCCEHVLDVVRRVVEVLLPRCPSPAVLATSRSPIGIAGESVYGIATGSEYVASLASGAVVIKAFNALYERYMAPDPRHDAGRQVLFYAGDDADAKERFASVFSAIGFAAVDAGTLREGGQLMQVPNGVLSGLNVLEQD